MSYSSDIKKMIRHLEKVKSNVHTELGNAVADCCLKVQSEAMKGMTNTEVDNSRTYGRHGHHPSVPYAYPAVDTGALRRSITFEVEEDGGSVKGVVGSTITNPPYPAYLEYGTSKMKPRPWMTPALESSMDYIKARYEKAMKDSV